MSSRFVSIPVGTAALIALFSIISALQLADAGFKFLRSREAPSAAKVRTALLGLNDMTIPVKHVLVALNGGLQRLAGRQSVSNTKDLDVAKLSDGTLTFGLSGVDNDNVGRLACENANYVREAFDYCSKRSIPFLFVLCPCKPVREGAPFSASSKLPSGIDDIQNASADAFVEKLQSMSVTTLDLRSDMAKASVRPEEFFFRTDHHWRPSSGLWASRIIADALKSRFGIQLDADLLSSARFLEARHSRFLGSLGTRTGSLYAGMDDYTCPVPRYDTDLEVSYDHKPESVKRGCFSNALFDESVNRPFRRNPYGEMLSGGRGYVRVVNNGPSNGKKLLMPRDSFGQYVAPYLALAFKEIVAVDFRQLKNETLVDFVNSETPDVVVAVFYTNATRSPHGPFPVSIRSSEQRANGDGIMP